jgi:hypothetical protein
LSIEKQYFSAMSNIFSPIVLDNIVLTGYSSYLKEIIGNCGLLRTIDLELPLFHFFNKVYELLFESYRTEYIYKNVLAHKILFSRHSAKNSNILSEFRVGKCKADIVILNGTSTVYEIKSDFDTYKRLENQLSTYSQVFDKIYVVTSEKQISKLILILPDHIGLMVLTNQKTLSTIREAKSNKHMIIPEVLFDSLRKDEYIKIIQTHYKEIPIVPNTLMHRTCKELYCRIPKELAFELTLNILRSRINISTLKSFVNKKPSKSLIAYAINHSNEPAKLDNIVKYLLKPSHMILSPLVKQGA